MTLKEALDILGLKENCTEEELKIAYRRLMKDNHPDKCGNNKDKEEFTKKINDARDIVKTNIKPKNVISDSKKDNSNNVIFTNLQQELEQETIKELEYISEIPFYEDLNFLKYREKFEYLIYDFNFKIKNATNVEHLRKIYSDYMIRYNELIQSYCIDLGMAIRVNPVDFYNCILTKNQILTLKEFRDKALEIINNILDNELDKYRTIEDYSILAPLLTAIRQTHALTCLWGQYNINTTKRELKKHLMFAINNYHKRKKILNELIISEVDKNIIDNLQQNILSEKEFYAIYNKIDKPSKAKTLGKRILKHFKQKNG